ncbi:MAG: response regulator [Rhodospirillales bacterium]|nr:response regulator [Alphaproteobacteria bacterium]USO03737.1 MAG: response regulator [Rhodospirillales bacterium]
MVETDKTPANKILVVEDNDFVRMQIVRYLSDAGYEVAEASHGDQAIDVMKTQPVDMAIVDVRMEPVDGFGFIKSIRGMDMDTPVILVTGDNNPDLLGQARTWGVGSVLIKPVQKDRLLKAVERTIQIHNRRRA